MGVELNVKLKEKIRESLSAVLPITGIVLMLSIFVIPMELGSVVMFLTGALMLIVGMGFFQLGAEMAMTPLGEGVGVQISKMKKSAYSPADRVSHGRHHYRVGAGPAGSCGAGAVCAEHGVDHDGGCWRGAVSGAGHRAYPL